MTTSSSMPSVRRGRDEPPRGFCVSAALRTAFPLSRFRSVVEVAAFPESLRDVVRRASTLALLTGLRRSEVFDLGWIEVSSIGFD